MLEVLFTLYQQFKTIKKKDDIVFTTGDREMFGLFAVAKAIESLAAVVGEAVPAIQIIADAMVNPPREISEQEFEISEEDLVQIKRALGNIKRALGNVGVDGTDDSDSDDAEVFVGDDEIPCDNCVDRLSNPEKEPCCSCEEGSKRTPDHE